MSGAQCCVDMARAVDWSCEQHADAYQCPDALVAFSARFQEYGLIVHDGGSSSVRIHHCPWFGRRLPVSQRERWFAVLEQRGIDPWSEDVPEEFTDERWLSLPT